MTTEVSGLSLNLLSILSSSSLSTIILLIIIINALFKHIEHIESKIKHLKVALFLAGLYLNIYSFKISCSQKHL